MIESIFMIALLIFVATLPGIVWGALSNPDAFKHRSVWRTPRISLWRSTEADRQNSDRFLAWVLLKTCQASFFVMCVVYLLARV